MRATPRRLVLTLALALALPATLPVFGPSATMQQAASMRPIELQDIIAWKTIGATAVSNDGQWFAYRIAPGEGDAQIVVRRTQEREKELTFDIGEPPAAAAARRRPRRDGGGGGSPALDFSDDSKWVAFTTYPSRAEAQRLRRQRRPVQSERVTIVNLATGEKRDYPRDSPLRVFGRRVDVDCAAASARQATGAVAAEGRAAQAALRRRRRRSGRGADAIAPAAPT